MIQNLSIPKLQWLAGAVRECFPRATSLIAGGAPRDLLNGKQVKDIDVFIHLDEVEAMIRDDPSGKWETHWRADGALWMEWANGCDALSDVLHCPWSHDGLTIETGGETDRICELTNSKGYGYGAFSLVDYPTGLHGHPIQLVFIDICPYENVNSHFDFGLSKLYVTPNRLVQTPDYWKDAHSKTITYLPSTEPNAQRRVSSRYRLERLKVKYNGWRFARDWLLRPTEDERQAEEQWREGLAKAEAGPAIVKHTPGTFRGKKGW